MYRFGWDMTASINQYIGSGIPISEEAYVGASHPVLPLRPRATWTAWTRSVNTDLSVFQNFNLGKLDLQLGLTVLNLFDQDAVTRRYNDRTVGSVPVTTEEFFAGGWNYEALIAGEPEPRGREVQPARPVPGAALAAPVRALPVLARA